MVEISVRGDRTLPPIVSYVCTHLIALCCIFFGFTVADANAADLIAHFDAARINGSPNPVGTSACGRTDATWVNLANPGENGLLAAGFNLGCSGSDGWRGSGTPGDPFFLSFDNSRVDIPTTPAATYAAWFAVDDDGDGHPGTVFWSDRNLGQQSFIRFERGNLQLKYRSGRWKLSGLGATQWHHVVMTNNGSETVFYFDGVEIAREANTTESILDRRQRFLGRSVSNASPLRGGIGSFRMYSDSLSKNEVENLFFSEKGRYYSTPASNAGPQIDRLLPAFSRTAGNTQITVYGFNLGSVTSVLIDGVPVPSFQVQTTNRLVFTTPAHAPGYASLTLSDANGNDVATNTIYFTNTPTDNVLLWLDAGNITGDGQRGLGSVNRSWYTLSNSGHQAGLVSFSHPAGFSAPGVPDSGWHGNGTNSSPYGLAFLPANSSSATGAAKSDHLGIPAEPAHAYAFWFRPSFNSLRTLMYKMSTDTYITANHTTLTARYNGGPTVQTSLQENGNYLFVITNDGNATHYYLNGVKFATAPGFPESSLPGVNTRLANIGSLYGNAFFKGCVGQVRTYGRHLSTTEVQAIVNESNLEQTAICGATPPAPPAECSDGVDNDNDGVADALDPGCWSNPNDPNTYDPNDDDESDGTTQCQDGIDNEGDGVADALDPGCWTNPNDPNTYDPTDNDESDATTQCQDTVDNDNDIVADAQDPGCWTNPNDPNTYDPTDNDESDATTQCQDTADNDGDSLADAADPGCWTDPNDPNTYDPTDNNEADATTECQDGVDNDGDIVADAADPGCWTNPNDPNTYNPLDDDESNATTQCQDGGDNDADIVIDAADPGCWTNPNDPNTYDPTDNDESNATTQCQDGADNDTDIVIDAADPGCWTNPNDPNTYDPTDNDESNATTQCQDGADNDADIVIDAADPGCWTNPNDPNTYDPTDNDESNATTQCQDGGDNDADIVIDAADPGCWTNPNNPNTYDPTDNDESNATTQCQDTLDNDNDIVADAADPGCWTNPNDPNTYDPTDNDESNATTQCQDGGDNDSDNLIDAADPGCRTNPSDPNTYDPTDNDESNATTQCQDGIDNEGDGVADAADPGCWTNPNDPNTYNPLDDDESDATTQCQDGADNDADIVIDAADPGCWTNPNDPNTYDPTDNDESNATTQCQDGGDNDSDNLIDAADPGCRTNPSDPNTYDPTDNDESNATTQCQDGIDNEGDGVADAADPGCWTNPNDPNTYNPLDDDESDATTQCQDGADNDNDIVIDAADPGCWAIPGEPSSYDRTDNDESNATTQCQDGGDNDSDNLIDAADPGCRTNPSDPNTYDPTDNDESNATTQCQDGIDNEGDGVADAADPGCWTDPTDPNTYNPLDDDESDATTQCQDGIDNEGDGVADAADPGCWTDPTDPNTFDPTDNDESDGTTQCQDGVDNEGDMLADAADPGCRTNPDDPNTYDPTDNDESDATTDCQDGIDNEGDGVADISDPGCYTDPSNPDTYDPTDDDEGDATTQCQDGIDNDSDTFTDFPNDPGCSSPTDNDERNNESTNAPQCDNGIDDDGDGLIDFPNDPHCDDIFDDSEAPACNDGIDNDGDGNTDFGEDSGCSSEDDDDENDPDLTCDDGQDNDGDSLIDFKADGSGDPGCLFPEDPSEDDGDAPLKSPVYTKFNTFLSQWNFLELIVQGEKGLAINVTVFNLFGDVMISDSLVVDANSEFDVDINNLVVEACAANPGSCADFIDLDENGVVDTYGLVKIEFDDSDPDVRLLSRLSNYRPNGDGTFSFAFPRILRNPSAGTTYAAANTFDPQAMGFLVPNWAELIYIENGVDNGPESFTYNLYTQEGDLVYTERVSLRALEERDFHAGHEIIDEETGTVVEGVYLAEIVPDNPNAKYFFSVARYSSNSLPGEEPDTYNYAFTIEGKHGTGEDQFARISNETFSCGSTTNWVEVANTKNHEVRIDVTYRDSAGGTSVFVPDIAIAPRSQFHFNASALLAKGTIGSIQVKANTMGSVIVQSLSYIHDCQLNNVQTAYVSLARSRARSRQTGTINSFLGMENTISVLATTEETVTAQLTVDRFSAGEVKKPLAIGEFGISTTSTFDDQEIKFPADEYGALTLVTPDIGQALTAVYRVRTVEEVRTQADGSPVVVEVTDFYMPTVAR